jgi:cystathionine beta-lyase/cystathionine gamma-synthase
VYASVYPFWETAAQQYIDSRSIMKTAFPRCAWMAVRHARTLQMRMRSGRSNRAITSSTSTNGRVETIVSLAETEVADVFLIQPRTRKWESHEDARAALEEAVSLVRAIPGWDVVGTRAGGGPVWPSLRSARPDG